MERFGHNGVLLAEIQNDVGAEVDDLVPSLLLGAQDDARALVKGESAFCLLLIRGFFRALFSCIF